MSNCYTTVKAGKKMEKKISFILRQATHSVFRLELVLKDKPKFLINSLIQTGHSLRKHFSLKVLICWLKLWFSSRKQTAWGSSNRNHLQGAWKRAIRPLLIPSLYLPPDNKEKVGLHSINITRSGDWIEHWCPIQP